MNRALATILFAGTALCALTARAESPSPRWAVIVGSNTEVLGRGPLRYAHRDAKQLSRALVDLGGFAEADVRTLLDPRPTEVLAALDSLVSKASDAEDGVVLFYYSGHADARALYPDGAPLPLGELKRRLQNPRVSLRVGIVDACRGGGWTGTKGFVPDEPFEVTVPDTPEARGTVFVASSSGDQAAHESETLAGSFFTHHFIAGLRGAADDDSDGVVALSEAYRYARQRTVRDAAIYASGEQHPSFRVQLSGRQDVSMTWLDRGSSTLVIGPRQGLMQIVDLDSGVTAFELPAGQTPRTLAMDEGRYILRRRDDTGASHVHEVDLRAGDRMEVGDDDLVAMPAPGLRAKTGVFGNAGSLEPGASAPNNNLRLRLTADGTKPLTFHLRTAKLTGSVLLAEPDDVRINAFRQVCVAPCETTVPSGLTVFGMTQGRSDEIVEARPVWIDSDALVKATYRDNSTLRHGGYVVGGLGFLAGAGLIAAGLASDPGRPAALNDGVERPNRRTPRAVAGLVTLTVGGFVAFLSSWIFADRVEIETRSL